MDDRPRHMPAQITLNIQINWITNFLFIIYHCFQIQAEYIWKERQELPYKWQA